MLIPPRPYQPRRRRVNVGEGRSGFLLRFIIMCKIELGMTLSTHIWYGDIRGTSTKDRPVGYEPLRKKVWVIPVVILGVG